MSQVAHRSENLAALHNIPQKIPSRTVQNVTVCNLRTPHHGYMANIATKKNLAAAALARISKEMAKPRETRSVRQHRLLHHRPKKNPDSRV
jgi:hypothetical protein